MNRDHYRIYAATLFFALHAVLVTYVHSTYLEQFVSAKIVGVIYAVGALLGIIGLSRMPHVLRLVGNRRFMLGAALIEVAALSLMSAATDAYLVVIGFALHQAIIPIMYFSFDIFFKHFSTRAAAGTSRGIFLTIINITYVGVPLIMGVLLAVAPLRAVYTLSLVMMLPLLLLVFAVKNFDDPQYEDINLIQALRKGFARKNVGRIITINFILQMFYVTMVIYMPLFLRQQIGFDWPTIGLIFTIMLTPFVIFELPLGKIADRYLGEKELLIAGLVIMATSTGLIYFVSGTSVIGWAVLLFTTRVGASFVEIMAESYFFKQLKDEDAGLLSLWRSLSGVAYAIIPLVMSAVLFFLGAGNTSFLFLTMAVILACAIPFAAHLKDTR